MHPSRRPASAQPGRRVERPGRTRRGLESPSLPTWSDATRVLASAETPAVTPSGPIFGLAASQGKETTC